MLPLLVAIGIESADLQPRDTPQTIVVIGKRIADASSELRACLARRCNPNEDIDATLKLAETQLLAGKYRDARTTLLASLRRNKGAADAYPVPVSDLYRANGNVAAHLGYDKDYYNSTWGIYRTLKDGLPSTDQRHFTALMEVAEMMYRTRGHERARHYYSMIAREARKAGRPDIAATADLRSAVRHLPPGGQIQKSEINRVANLQGEDARSAVLEAKLALMRLAFEKDDEPTVQSIQRELSAFKIDRPILVYAPPYKTIERELDNGSEFAFPQFVPPPVGGEPNSGSQGFGGATVTRLTSAGQWSTTKRIPGNFDDMWIDVAFRITPEGKVADARIARSKGDLYWTQSLMESIRARRYTPGKLNDPLSKRQERYTYTSGYEVQTGSRFAQRSPKARIEYFDLSDMTVPN